MSQLNTKILIVEDEPSQAEVLRTLLEAHLFEVILAENGEAAIEASRCQQPDLILMDVMMPKVDGFASCKSIKSYGATSRIPIIILTVKNTTGDYQKGALSGADAYITKPYNSQYLLNRIYTFLNDRTFSEVGKPS